MNVEYLKHVAKETLEVVDRGWSVGRRLLLGASGCGVFGNDAREVFGAFEDALLPSPRRAIRTAWRGRLAGSEWRPLMATLAERLNGIKAAFAKQADEATRDVMHRATQALIDSGQAGRAVGEGATMPAFTAPAADGRSVSSDQLLGAGPLIVTFFRGHW